MSGPDTPKIPLARTHFSEGHQRATEFFRWLPLTRARFQKRLEQRSFIVC